VHEIQTFLNRAWEMMREPFKITTSLMMKKYLAAFKEKPLGLK
jgi:hypothetical protein